MISKEEFFKLLINYQNYDNRVSKITDVLGINFFELDICEYTYSLFDTLIHTLFKDEACEDINWWLNERNPNDPEPQMWKVINGKHIEIPTKTLDDLWNIIKDYRK